MIMRAPSPTRTYTIFPNMTLFRSTIEAELARLRSAIAACAKGGLRVNAGHGLHYENVQAIVAMPGIAELNIGHAIVARAVFDGWEKAVRDMKALLRKG